MAILGPVITRNPAGEKPAPMIRIERVKAAVFCLGILALFHGANGAGVTERRELMISAAISLKNVLLALAPAFEKANPGTRLSFNFGASGQLRMQIENDAPVDVFMAASPGDLELLVARGSVDPATRVELAKNRLILVRNRDKGPPVKELRDLLKPEVARVVIGNPKTVPAGRYAREALERSGLVAMLGSKLIFAENARQILDYVARGEADAAFVYATDALSEPKVAIVEVLQRDRHSPIVYPAALVRKAGNSPDARRWLEFLGTAEALAAFRKHGFE